MPTNHTVQHGDEVRPATAAEVAEWQSACEAGQQSIEVANERAAAKQSARTKLAALGLTEAEVAALLGV